MHVCIYVNRDANPCVQFNTCCQDMLRYFEDSATKNSIYNELQTCRPTAFWDSKIVIGRMVGNAATNFVLVAKRVEFLLVTDPVYS